MYSSGYTNIYLIPHWVEMKLHQACLAIIKLLVQLSYYSGSCTGQQRNLHCFEHVSLQRSKPSNSEHHT